MRNKPEVIGFVFFTLLMLVFAAGFAFTDDVSAVPMLIATSACMLGFLDMITGRWKYRY